jgi:hypothetical protein
LPGGISTNRWRVKECAPVGQLLMAIIGNRNFCTSQKLGMRLIAFPFFKFQEIIFLHYPFWDKCSVSPESFQHLFRS